MATKARRATAADIAAAVKLGTIDPTTEVVTDAELRGAVLAASEAIAADRAAQTATQAPAELPSTAHDCGVPGCKHGDAHPAVSQPDRQVKLQCPNCNAVARMTSAALRKCGGITCSNDGGSFAIAPRRTYTKRGA